MDVKDLTITSVETIDAFDVVTGDYKFTLDELQNVSIANTEEKVDITGKQGRKLSSLKRNKAVTISGSNGLVSGGLLAVQTGGTFENKSTEIMWTEYVAVGAEHSATIKYKAIGTTGSEIVGAYIRNADGTLGTYLTQAENAETENTFSYNDANKTLTFNDGIAENTEVVVYYKRRIKGDVLDNMSENYSGKATLYINAMAEDKCANVYRIQFFVPKADFSGEFNIDMGDDQTVHEFEAEALAGACGVGGMMWTYTVFGVNAEDDVTP